MLAALRTKRTAQRVEWLQRFYYTLPVVLACYLMFFMDIDVPWLQHRLVPRTETMAIVAIVITFAGLAFAIWARVYLGRNWSSAPTIKVQHQLIRSGPYRYVSTPDS